MSARPEGHRRAAGLPRRPAALRAARAGAWAAAAVLPVLLLALGVQPWPAAGAEPPPSDPPTVREQRVQIQQLGKERSQARQQLEQIQASESELRLEIDKLSELVRESHQRKEALEQRIVRQQELSAEQGREAKRLEAEVRASERRIGLRMRRLYRMAKQGRSSILFQMARFQTFAKDTRYLALLQDEDRAAIERFQTTARELVDKKKQIEDSVQRLIGLRAELDDESRLLADRQEYLRKAIADVGNNRTLYRKYLTEVEQMMTRMESAVTQMEAAARAAAPPPAPRKPEELRGALPSPVQGEVIAAFGAQDPRYDLKKTQRGILVRVGAKAAVTAVAAGRAVHAGPFRGYQSLVVLDHGSGLFTVYGHLEELQVKRGDWVPPGATLGVATYQPVDEAYDVYFEIRHDGKPDDPLAWLAPGALKRAAETQ